MGGPNVPRKMALRTKRCAVGSQETYMKTLKMGC